MKRFVAFFAERSLLINIISIGILIAGIMFLARANREAFPKVDFDWVIVRTLYPGATAEDIEKHISIPIEDQLREVDGIEELYTTSVESQSIAAIKLDPDLENKDSTINDIKNAIDRYEEFPEDAEDPIVQELKTSQRPILNVSVMSKKGIKNDEDERKLRTHAKMLEDRMLEVDGVAKVTREGYRDREMVIEVDPILLDRYHVAINDVVLALSKRNLNFPGGQVKTQKEEIMVRTIGEVENTEDIGNVLIRANDIGNWVRVKDVARVKDSFDEEVLVSKTNSEQAVNLTVVKKESGDIIDVVDEIFRIVDNFKEKYSKEYDFVTSRDLSYFVKRRLKVLKYNAIVGFILVMLSLFLTLGWRIALVTTIGLPIAFCIAFIWMGQQGLTINLISMFGLIVVLGMLVDDAIIVAENIYRHLEEGKDVRSAVIEGTTEVIVPVAGTIMTTIAAFSPLMLMTGIMGKFMWALPAVVSVALIGSWIESMLILPSHVLDIEKRNKKPVHLRREEKEGLYPRVKARYQRALVFVLNNRYKFSLLIMIVFVGTILFAKKNSKFILFPQGNIDRFFIYFEAPKGTTVQEVSRKLVNFEKVVAKLPPEELESFDTLAGKIVDQSMRQKEKTGSNYGTISVYLTPEQDRHRKTSEIIKWIKKETKAYIKDFDQVDYENLRTGPPVGEPVNITIKGDSFPEILKVADIFKKYLEKVKGITDVKDNFDDPKKELKIFLKDKVSAIAGISVFDVASTVRASFKGTVATKIKKSDEEIDIRVIFPEKFRNNINNLKLVKVSNRIGNLVPLNQIASFQESEGISLISRIDRKRAVRVTANIDEKAKHLSSVYINNLLQKDFAGVEKDNPGIIVDYLGEFKDTQESMSSLRRSFLIAVIIIYIILVGIFRSLLHPLIVMSVIPLSFIGVVWVFYFHGMPLSFLSIMGIVGLAGVVVNDSIVLVDFIRNARAQGLSPYEATVEAGGNRLRAIFLTTLTTFLGLVPTAYGIGGLDPFLVPMAVSMAWGIAFGTFITLFATPLLYLLSSDLRILIMREEKPADSFTVHLHPEDNLPAGYITREQLEDDIKRDIEEEIKKEIEDDLKRDLVKDMKKRISEKKPGKKKTAAKKKGPVKKKKVEKGTSEN